MIRTNATRSFVASVNAGGRSLAVFRPFEPQVTQLVTSCHACCTLCIILNKDCNKHDTTQQVGWLCLNCGKHRFLHVLLQFRQSKVCFLFVLTNLKPNFWVNGLSHLISLPQEIYFRNSANASSRLTKQTMHWLTSNAHASHRTP